MPAATAASFTGIHNENEFYSHHYLSEIFSGDIRATVDRWRDAADAEGGMLRVLERIDKWGKGAK